MEFENDTFYTSEENTTLEETNGEIGGEHEDSD